MKKILFVFFIFIGCENPVEVESKNILPAGKYWIGDPGFIIADSIYGEFTDTIFLYQDQIIKFRNQSLFVITCNENFYKGSNNFNYVTDGGIIGVIPYSLCDTTSRDKNLGTFITFEKSFKVSFIDNVFSIDTLKIIIN